MPTAVRLSGSRVTSQAILTVVPITLIHAHNCLCTVRFAAWLNKDHLDRDGRMDKVK